MLTASRLSYSICKEFLLFLTSWSLFVLLNCLPELTRTGDVGQGPVVTVVGFIKPNTGITFLGIIGGGVFYSLGPAWYVGEGEGVLEFCESFSV